jgi:hypothetical protein
LFLIVMTPLSAWVLLTCALSLLFLISFISWFNLLVFKWPIVLFWFFCLYLSVFHHFLLLSLSFHQFNYAFICDKHLAMLTICQALGVEN